MQPRRVLTARALALTALTAVAAVAVVALLALGQWQWQRSRPGVLVATLPTVDVATVLVGPQRLLTRDQGRLVTAGGTWRPDRQLLVAARRAPGGGEPLGRWLVTALELDTGQLLPVVRGWVAGDVDVASLPQVAGEGAVSGWVQASEPLDISVEVVQAPGQVALLAAADLVNRWPEDVTDGFVIARTTDAADIGSVVHPLPGPVEAARAGRDWRNVAYAAQWWVFAAFTVVLWWRTLRDAPREDDAVAVTGTRDLRGRT